MSNVFVAFSPNDFFYVNTQSDDFYPSPTDVSGGGRGTDFRSICHHIRTIPFGDASCTTFFIDNSANCLKKQVCDNMTQVDAIRAVDASHNMMYNRNLDTSDDLRKTFINTVNLTVGILFVVFVFIKLRRLSRS
jgi:hypothetical protein